MARYAMALITGASSGIGAAFARALAAQGTDLVLVARSVDRLEALAVELRSSYGRVVHVVPVDLTSPGAAVAVKAELDARGVAVDLLINNAGFGTTGRFVDQDAQRELDEISLNAGAVVAMSHAFLPTMLAWRHGAIMNIASTAAFQPMPYFAVYAATKAFVHSFSDALWLECAGAGVHVMAVCPGPVDTPFFENIGTRHRLREVMPKATMATPEAVAAKALAGLACRQRLVIPGLTNKIGASASRLFPRSWVTRLVGGFMQR